MKLKLVRHLWGVGLTHGLQHHLPRWREVGYLHTLPHTNVPVADLANVCDWMARRQQKWFDSTVKHQPHNQ